MMIVVLQFRSPDIQPSAINVLVKQALEAEISLMLDAVL